MSDDRFEDRDPPRTIADFNAEARERVQVARLQPYCDCGGVGFVVAKSAKGHHAIACPECKQFPDDAAAEAAALRLLARMRVKGPTL
jgi:hypothetical protein